MKKVTTKIIHIPWIYVYNIRINIAPIEITKNTVFDYYTSDYSYQVNSQSIFGYTDPSYKYGIYCGLYNNNQQTYLHIGKASISNTSNPYWYNLFFNYKKDLHIKIGFNYTIVNNIRYDVHLTTHAIHSYDNFYLGNSYIDSYYYTTQCKIHYFRIERKNSLYKHYLPCVRFYNLVDDDNTIIQENLLDWGFFESVNQDYYIAGSNSIPAHTGDTLNENYSNLLDINGNIIPI